LPLCRFASRLTDLAKLATRKQFFARLSFLRFFS